ncbi:MAG: hypothetical protein N2C14_28860, partial [Planctomycetales bacterium]
MNAQDNTSVPTRRIGMTRREWIAGAATGAVAVALASDALSFDAQADEEEKRPWVDAHSHIWTRDVKNFPLAKGATLDDLAPPSFTAEELLKIAHPERVGRVVLIQHFRYHGWDNSYLVDAARRYPEAFRVVGMVDNFSDSPGDQMRRLLKQRVTGFRVTPGIYKEKWLGGGMDVMW